MPIWKSSGTSISPGFKSVTLPILFNPREGKAGLEKALERFVSSAPIAAIDDGATILILVRQRRRSRAMRRFRRCWPSAGLHHHLIRAGTRTRVGLVLESGEPREVHHFCLLIGYGVQAINPYLAFECSERHDSRRLLHEHQLQRRVKKLHQSGRQRRGESDGQDGHLDDQVLLRRADLRSGRLGQELVDKYFTWTPSRVGGIGLEEVAREAQRQHDTGVPDLSVNGHTLEVYGQYQWRNDGELHLFNPQTIHLSAKGLPHQRLQDVQRIHQADRRSVRSASPRCADCMDFKYRRKPIPIEEVEPVEAIVKRFKTGAMSYGSISKEAHEALAIAMNRIGGKSNTGEGGEDPARYVLDANGDSHNSAIKQVASGRFGVTSYYLTQAQRAADQDGPRRQAGRRRRIARAQSLSVDRQGAPLDARRRV